MEKNKIRKGKAGNKRWLAMKIAVRENREDIEKGGKEGEYRFEELMKMKLEEVNKIYEGKK